MGQTAVVIREYTGTADDIRPAELARALHDAAERHGDRFEVPAHFACPLQTGTVCECGGRGLCLDVA